MFNESTKILVILSNNFLIKGRGGLGTDLFSLVTTEGQNTRDRPEVVSEEVWVRYQKKAPHQEGSWELEQAPQGTGHSIQADRV